MIPRAMKLDKQFQEALILSSYEKCNQHFINGNHAQYSMLTNKHNRKLQKAQNCSS